MKASVALEKVKNKRHIWLYLDLLKAFDTVDRELLFLQLWKNGIQGKAWHMVKMLYKNVNNHVIFGSFESEHYEVQNGVNQGCIMSPCLFNLVMQDLGDMLSTGDKVAVDQTCIVFSMLIMWC